MGKDKRRGEASRRAKQERHERSKKQAKSAQRKQHTAVAPTRFVSDAGSSAALAESGPQFFCLWAIPAATAEAMRKANRPVPAPIAGALLLDTGAIRTCIALKTANDLGLKPTRMQDGFGAGGKHSNPIFLAQLHIRIVDPKTNLSREFSWEQEVQGIPELHQAPASLSWKGQAMPVTGLLGRDILKFARIFYDGPAGRMRFEFDVASMQAQPSR